MFVLVMALMGVLAPGVALGHPHIFVTSSVEVRFGGRGPESLQVSWTFDHLYSAVILRTFERDAEGGFSPAAIARIEREHMAALRGWNYFLEMSANGSPVPVTGIRDFDARVNRAQVTYVFTVPIMAPAEADGTLRILVDDLDYYFAFSLAEPVGVQAHPAYQAECRVARDPATKRPEGIRCDYRRR